MSGEGGRKVSGVRCSLAGKMSSTTQEEVEDEEGTLTGRNGYLLVATEVVVCYKGVSFISSSLHLFPSSSSF